MPASENRLSAALADRYRIERELGAGGMATVYLAEDLKHKRRVAVKVLKPELAAVLGAERFVQEITTTAALQHPHILPLFDSGEADGFLYYVMPFIDGETLRDKLDRETQLGVDEAVKITTDVADALHYAHSQGIVHRDIKPENILLANGRPMVADFGIALAVSAAAGGRMTETGLSLGTPHYMSPEQATAEKDISARSDQYSLASVLYEMLTGNLPHTGASAQQIIMKIITEQPAQVTSLRKSVPPHVAAAVAKALEKLPADRFASTRAFAESLSNPGFTVAGGQAVGTNVGVRSSARSSRIFAAVAGVLAVALVASLVVRPAPVSVPLARFDITPGDGTLDYVTPIISLSVDGTRMAYAVGLADSSSEIRLRSIEALGDSRIPGTENAGQPALSQDGTTLAFVRDGVVHILPIAGSVPPTVIGEGNNPVFSDGGALYFVRRQEILRVPAEGGQPAMFAVVANGEPVQPHPLPDDAGLLFTIRRSTADQSRIAFVGPDGQEVRELLDGTSAFFAAPSTLVFTDVEGTLFGAPFDIGTLTVGAPTALISDIKGSISSQTALALSASGALLYQMAGPQSPQELVWVDRTGAETPLDSSWRGSFRAPALSPDGRQLAVEHDGELWVRQLDRGPDRRLASAANSAWTPEGDSVLFGVDSVLYARRADGSGQAVAVVRDERGVAASTWSPDRSWRVYRTNRNFAGAGDLRAVRPGLDSRPIDIAATPAFERSQTFSPDGRWLAYVSDETGQPEVYVVGFPDTTTGRWPVSLAGGTEVRGMRCSKAVRSSARFSG